MQKDIHRINEIIAELLKVNVDSKIKTLLEELSLLIKKRLRNNKEFEEFNLRLKLFIDQ